MKFQTITLTLEKMFLGVWLALVGGFVAACSDDDKIDVDKPYDPSQPVVITSFTPESGSYQENIIVKGQNFGNDKNLVTLKIGGKEAVIVNVLYDKLYAYIPSGAFTEADESSNLYTGTVELSVTYGHNTQTATAPKKFRYLPKRVVGTLCGYQNENDSQGEVWGSFDIAAGFNAEGCMTFDPLYPNRLYIAYDRGEGFLAQLDLDSRTSTRLMSASKFQNSRLRNIAFTLDGKYMLVSTDRDNSTYTAPSVWIVERNSDGTFSDRSSPQLLAAYKQCNGVAVHPINGEVYFNSYSNGELFRLDINEYLKTLNPEPSDNGEEPKEWTGLKTDGAFRELFKIQDPSYEFQITIHPSGDYAYLTVINRDYILRTDYNRQKKEFTTPYVVVGANGAPNWIDAVGSNARVHRPYQGIFVKNPEYVKEGRADVYDYYFCDCLNFCVRYITPEGLVRTYAGRGLSTNGNIWGTEDGDLRQQARFRDVTGIAYDEKRERFYVLDHNNRRIRTIGLESTDTKTVAPDEPETGGEGTEKSAE